MKKERPDLLILIDSQGINMPLAKAAKKLGIKTVYYIAPQEWLWGTTRGIKNVVQTIDRIIAIFSRENDIYKAAGGNVYYFGHPLIDIVKSKVSTPEVRKEYLGDVTGPVVALCPGSRVHEIRKLFPILLKAGQKIKAALPQAKFLIPAASTEMIKLIFDMVDENFRPKAIIGHTYDILAASDLALCASGTINLEASILGVPNIMIYKLNPLTYFIGKNLLKIGEKLPFYSMPNILLKEKVLPELVMEQANPETVALEALAILNNPERQQLMKSSFAKLKTLLGQPGVIARAAKEILSCR
jgi:lipid-A-disaccharide synthase